METPHRPSLDPHTADFSFGARIALTKGVGDWNVMQKGFYNDRQWKLSTQPTADGAKLSCRVAGSAGVVFVATSTAVVPTDGSWHQVGCARVGDQVQVRVDGSVVATGSGPMGDVSSTRNYLIGSKGSGQLADPDQYLGLLDDAFVVTDDGGGGGGGTPPLTDTATATVETVPVSHVGDAADDPAIWPHPTDPAKSLVIGNDKEGALDVYDLDGQLVQRFSEGFFGNVDLRTGVRVGTQTRDLVAVWRAGLRLYSVNPTTRQLTNVTDGVGGSIAVPTGGEGLCLYREPSGRTSAVVIARNGTMAQYVLADADGDSLVDATPSRTWTLGSEAEGCVADDVSGALFVSEEDVALWRYGADPNGPTTTASRVAIDRVTTAGGRLLADIEGLAIVDDGNGEGYLIASAQAGSDSDNFYAVYDRAAPHSYVRSFAVGAGTTADNCGRTDGIAAYSGDLGPAFPHGIFVCQDNTNTLPGNVGNQNFKFVPLERVVPRGDQPSPPPNAAFDVTGCEQLTCTFAGADSVAGLTYEWRFGDGTTGVGRQVIHEFAASGTYQVTLAVTDEQGGEATTSQQVSVRPASAKPIAFRAAAAATANWTSVSPVVPASVQVGDAMLLVVTGNRSDTQITAPPGWRALGAQADESMQTRVWERTAMAADSGAAVRVTVSQTTKIGAQIVAYDGVDPDNPVIAVQSASENGTGSGHRTPLAGSQSGDWGVSIWTNKTAAATGWTVPSGVSVRNQVITTGGGRVTALLADSGGPVAGTTYGGLTAVASEAGSKATMWTVVLAPAN